MMFYDFKFKILGGDEMILCIVGPTGVGKTKMSVELAKKYNAIIINCDAMQVYQGLNIGTAKILEEEKEGVEHYLFDFVSPLVNYTVFDYQKDARALLEKFKDRNIIFVGGTGLYLKAALFDYRFSKEEKKDFNYDSFSNEELLKKCLEKDPNCSIHVHNRKRLIRFLERENTTVVEPKPLYNATIIGLTTDRHHLYELINKRVEKMMQDGLLEEVKSFYDQNVHSKALETGIGYKELYKYFDGKCSLEDAILEIQKNSRHYAKRQYTFFNHQFSVKWFDVHYDHFDDTVKEVQEYIDAKKN